jgi:DNA-binding MarR family transcriptional regulator
MPARSPSPLDAHLGFWLRYVSNNVSGRFKRLLEDQGATVTEWVALRTLLDRPETNTAELIAALGITKGAASKVIARLEEKGWVRRALSASHAREQVLGLTKAGRAIVPVLAAQADANEEHFFGHLDPAERAGLVQVFQELVAHHRLQEMPVE